MPKKILFLIRGKLGDSLIAYSVFRQYADRHPDDSLSLLIRRNYAALLREERGFRLIPYRNRLQAIARVLASRLFGQGYDAFAVLWGFGGIVPLLARVSNTKRRLYLDDRYRDVLPEYPSASSDARQIDPSWRVAKLLDPALEMPGRLVVKSLAGKRRAQPSAIGITPLSDEQRRNMDTATLERLLWQLRSNNPRATLRVFLNPGEERILPASLPSATEINVFHTLPELVAAYSDLCAWYGTDTGLYHLAAAMNIPCRVFFGPSQPTKVILPRQRATGIRLRALADVHCEEKDCERPVCLFQAVSNYCGQGLAPDLERTPAGCPLRRFDPQALLVNKRHENPDHQTR